MKIPLGIPALALGCAIAVVGLGLYQAWWTVVFPVGGAMVAMLERRGFRAVETMAVGAAVAVCLALGGLGAFLMVMSGRSCARPDLPCPDGPPALLLVGAGALFGSLLVLAVIAAFVRRRLRMRSSAIEGASRDIPER